MANMTRLANSLLVPYVDAVDRCHYLSSDITGESCFSGFYQILKATEQLSPSRLNRRDGGFRFVVLTLVNYRDRPLFAL